MFHKVRYLTEVLQAPFCYVNQMQISHCSLKTLQVEREVKHYSHLFSKIIFKLKILKKKKFIAEASTTTKILKPF